MAKMLDRNLKGIGRIQKAFGTDDIKIQNGIRQMVTNLYENGNWDILKDIIEGQVTLLQVYSKWKFQKLHEVTATSIVKYSPTVFEWLKKYTEITPETKRQYEVYFNALLTIKNDFALEELPEILKKYRAIKEKEGKGSMFNKMRAAVRSFVGNYFDVYHPLYVAIGRVKPLPAMRKRQGHPMTVKEASEIRDRLPPKLGEQFWNMCISGVGMTEYLNGLDIEGEGVRIKGEKVKRVDDRRNRLVPNVGITMKKPYVRDRQLRNKLYEITKKDIQVYDTRRTYARWCIDAGIPYDRTQQYMGHAPQSMTERYSRAVVGRYLEEDAQLLITYIANELIREGRQLPP